VLEAVIDLFSFWIRRPVADIQEAIDYQVGCNRIRFFEGYARRVHTTVRVTKRIRSGSNSTSSR